MGAWNNLMEEYEKSNFSGVSAVCYSSKQELKRIFETVMDPTSRTASIASAALHTVALTYKTIVQEEIHFDASRLTYLCEKYLASFPNLWTSLFEQVSTCPVRDNKVREIFSSVRDAIISIIANANARESSDLTDIKATLKGMRLFVPSDAAVGDLEIPYVTKNFGVGYVNMKLFEYAIHRQLKMKGQPSVNLLKNRAVAGDTFLAVSPFAYELLDITHPEGRLLNTPVVGTFIAQAIWKYAFLKTNWKESIWPVINKFYRCPVALEESNHSSTYQEVMEFAFVVPTLLVL
ncbi:hypothetical protein HPB47_007587 [Ixodes persulcatus]|uniref:Uncharacterized protein n=1 Tax=Ixodes persulcatus TaxID=34615 RepID=A0AC60P726_IXOPE|nr:hypothetical protein HPB47_007587 [Ixodes persulcatus]